MIIGIGTDLVTVERIEKVFQSYAGTFTKRLLCPEEQPLFEESEHKGRFLAKRWASKEAISKAFGTGIGETLSLQDIIVSKKPSGQPCVAFNKSTINSLKTDSLRCHLSLTDEGSQIIAFAVLEKID